MIHLRVRVLSGYIDFTAFLGIDMGDALRSASVIYHSRMDQREAHLDMTNSSICTLIESTISNPGINAEKCNDLIVLCVFRYWKSTQNLHTDAVVDVV